MKKIKITDTVLLGEWKEVQDMPLSSITKKDTDTAILDGLILSLIHI